MNRQLRWIAAAVAFGALAVVLPGLVGQAGAGADSPIRAAIEQPSVWTFHGLFVVAFVIGAAARLSWIDTPLLALAMVGFFPALALVQLALGSSAVQWPREFYLYAAWLIPALLGLVVGKLIRDIARKTFARKR